MRAFATLLVVLLASCAPKNAQQSSPIPAPVPLKWSDLAGTPFVLTSLTAKGTEIPVPATRRPTIQFGDESRVSGMAGVNRYSTTATISAFNVITWNSPPIATKMAGPPEAMALENAFFQSLEIVSRIESRDGKLNLTSADGATRMEFSR